MSGRPPIGVKAGVAPFALALALALAPAGSAKVAQQNQPPGVAEVDPGSKLIIYDPISNAPQPDAVTLDFDGDRPAFIFRNPFGVTPGFGCQYEIPQTVVMCFGLPGGNVIRYVIELGSGKNRATVSSSVPKLPGPNQINGGKGPDKVEGGKSDEEIKTGKGKDTVDPGKGEDRVVSGPGDDSVDTTDGQEDDVNCGLGDDMVRADKKDNLKGCEEVK